MRTNVTRADRGLTVTRALLLVAAVGLIGVLAYRQVGRLLGGPAHVAVWVTATDLDAGKIVTGPSLKMARMAPPRGALVNRSDIEGRTLIRAKAKDEPFYVADLEPRPPAPSLSGTVPAGRLLATIRVDALDLPVSELRAGDRLDLMQAEPDGVRLVAHDAYVMGVMETTAPQAPRTGSGMIMGVDISVPSSRNSTPRGSSLVLALHPRDVFPLAAAEGSGRPMKIVVHAEREIRSGKLLSVLPPAAPRRPAKPAAARETSVELLVGSKRQTLRFPEVAPPPAPESPRPGPTGALATLR